MSSLMRNRLSQVFGSRDGTKSHEEDSPDYNAAPAKSWDLTYSNTRTTKNGKPVSYAKPHMDEHQQQGTDTSNSANRCIHKATSFTFKSLSNSLRSKSRALSSVHVRRDRSPNVIVRKKSSHVLGLSSLRHRGSQNLMRRLQAAGKRQVSKELVAISDPRAKVEHTLDVEIPHYKLSVPGQGAYRSSSRGTLASLSMFQLFNGYKQGDVGKCPTEPATDTRDYNNELGEHESDIRKISLAKSNRRSRESAFFQSNLRDKWFTGISPFRHSKLQAKTPPRKYSLSAHNRCQTMSLGRKVGQAECFIHTASNTNAKYLRGEKLEDYNVDDESGTESPVVPSMGSQSQWNARGIERQKRYGAICASGSKNFRSVSNPTTLQEPKKRKRDVSTSDGDQPDMAPSMYKRLHYTLQVLEILNSNTVVSSVSDLSDVLSKMSYEASIYSTTLSSAKHDQEGYLSSPAASDISSLSSDLSYTDEAVMRPSSQQKETFEADEEAEIMSHIINAGNVGKYLSSPTASEIASSGSNYSCLDEDVQTPAGQQKDAFASDEQLEAISHKPDLVNGIIIAENPETMQADVPISTSLNQYSSAQSVIGAASLSNTSLSRIPRYVRILNALTAS